jgi:Protein of unknown function (DUF3887)
MGTPYKSSIGTRRAAVVVVAGVVLSMSLSGCGKSGTASQTTSAGATNSSVTAAPSSSATAPANGNYDQAALQLLDAIIKGDFASATANFNAEMQQKLSAQALSQAWTQYQQLYGAYQSHGNPQHVQKGHLVVEDVPLQMQNGPGLFRATFGDQDGKVAGIWFLKPGAPAP